MPSLVVELASDEARLVNGYRKAVAAAGGLDKANKSLEGSARRSGAAMRTAGDSGNRAFGPAAFRQLNTFIGGWVSVGSAVQGVTKLFGDLRRVQDEAAQSAREQLESAAKLAQVGDTPELTRELRIKSRVQQAKGLTAEEANNLVFQLQSAGALEQADIFGNLRAARIIGDPADAIKSTKFLQTAFGKGKAGTLEEIIAKGFTASGATPENLEALLGAGAETGQFASQLGIDPNETLAAIGALSNIVGVSKSGTQVTSLLAAAQSVEGEALPSGKAFKAKGVGLLGILDQLGSLDSSQLEELIGKRKEARAGLASLLGLKDQIAALTEEIRATKPSVAGQKALQSAQSDPVIAATLARNRAEARESIILERAGAATNLAEAFMSELRRHSVQDLRGKIGGGLVGATMEGIFQTPFRTLMGDEQFLEAAANDPRIRGTQIQRDIRQFLDTGRGELTETAAETLDRAANKQLEAAQAIERAAREQQSNASALRAEQSKPAE